MSVHHIEDKEDEKNGFEEVAESEKGIDEHVEEDEEE